MNFFNPPTQTNELNDREGTLYLGEEEEELFEREVGQVIRGNFLCESLEIRQLSSFHPYITITIKYRHLIFLFFFFNSPAWKISPSFLLFLLPPSSSSFSFSFNCRKVFTTWLHLYFPLNFRRKRGLLFTSIPAIIHSILFQSFTL